MGAKVKELKKSTAKESKRAKEARQAKTSKTLWAPSNWSKSDADGSTVRNHVRANKSRAQHHDRPVRVGVTFTSAIAVSYRASASRPAMSASLVASSWPAEKASQTAPACRKT